MKFCADLHVLLNYSRATSKKYRLGKISVFKDEKIKKINQNSKALVDMNKKLF